MRMNREYLYMMENMLGSVASASGLSSLVGILGYVFASLALYIIARRREIRKPWLAWVPVVNVWILGCISDQYRYVTKGQVKNKRKILLAVGVLKLVLTCAAMVKLIVSVALVFSGVAQNISEMEIIRMVMSTLVFLIPVLLLGIVGLVFEIMALYDLYSSCEPENNILYLILSLIPGISHITRPIFLFLCRNKDEGMPPRREDVPEYTEE